jgi:hypothetical protein
MYLLCEKLEKLIKSRVKTKNNFLMIILGFENSWKWMNKTARKFYS